VFGAMGVAEGHVASHRAQSREQMQAKDNSQWRFFGTYAAAQAEDGTQRALLLNLDRLDRGYVPDSVLVVELKTQRYGFTGGRTQYSEVRRARAALEGRFACVTPDDASLCLQYERRTVSS